MKIEGFIWQKNRSNYEQEKGTFMRIYNFHNDLADWIELN